MEGIFFIGAILLIVIQIIIAEWLISKIKIWIKQIKEN